MSYIPTRQDVLYRQRLLRAAGLYAGELDGSYGPQTALADQKWAIAHSHIEHMLPGTWGGETVARLRTLLPRAAFHARQSLISLSKAGLYPRIGSATRTYAEQDALYAQGRSTAGDVVTQARGGQSKHNFGIAWDITLHDAKGRYLTYDSSGSKLDDYARIGDLCRIKGIVEWGGDWPKRIADQPHLQMVTGVGTEELRERFEKGIGYLTP